MQRHSSNESNVTIPPNLLKNFNVYDILEPQKNCATNSDVSKVDKLIDIDDCSQDSGFQDSDLNAALLDKNRDFDLVDLYQNIFVTPQHIKKKEVSEDVDTTFTASREFDVGFKHFFDMLESEQKVDWTNIAQSKEEAISKHKYIEEKPRVLVPKVLVESDSDPDDLIDEVLAQKNLERRVFGNISNSSPKVNLESVKKFKNSDIIPEFSRLSLNNSIIKDSKFESRINENVPRPSDIKTCLDSQINNSLTTFIVRAVQKDEKLYKKKRIMKPEHLKANYTKGPDFHEKSIVLPQIMARLDARLAYLDQKGNQKKRLILDTGAKPVKAECSKYNSNEQVKRKSDKQTECGTSTENDQVKKAPNGSSSGVNSINLGRIPIRKDPQLCINKLTKNIAVHTTDKPCMNCSKLSAGQAGASVKTDTEYGKLSPIVLMADCNRERLKALKQSQMFKDFVYKGKYDL